MGFEISLFPLAAVIVTLAAVFGYINFRWLGLPATIGLVVIALVVSIAVIIFDVFAPGFGIQETVRGVLAQVDFSEALMKGMLSFLLFAGALHVNLETLLERKWVIGLLATIGVMISTVLIGTAMYFVFGWFGVTISYAYCLVFGALISPTDPVAVLGILKRVKVPPSLEAKIAGESLLNDGVGVVVFTVLSAVAVGGEGGGHVGVGEVALLFLEEAVGGAVLGLVAGYIAYRAMRSIDEHNLEVLITLALVMGTYTLALAVEMSGPIAMVVAGIMIGNHGTRFAMSESTRDHVEKFWSLTDEILNAVLFLLIGFEVVALTLNMSIVALMAIGIPVALTARLISVFLPVGILDLRHEFTTGAIRVLTWGGLRGGISVALALALPNFEGKGVLLAVTYGIVVFSILVQGLTFEPLVKRVVR